MKETMEVASVASAEIEAYLRSKKETVNVINVENDKQYQKKDIDLIWRVNVNGKERDVYIEIKGDRYSHTGNFFIETISNREKNTPGCFMYTEADYIFYYFMDTKELNIMPVKKSRDWFIKNIDRFSEKFLSTKVGNGAFYTSAGRLVPKEIMKKELGIKQRYLETS